MEKIMEQICDDVSTLSAVQSLQAKCLAEDIENGFMKKDLQGIYPNDDQSWIEGYGTGFVRGYFEALNNDKKIINMLINMLQTSKNYHLGITALDSPEEVIEKRKVGETALIRNIEDKIKRAKRAIGE